MKTQIESVSFQKTETDMQTNLIQLTKHAKGRMQHRGYNKQHLATILHYADKFENAGRGAERIYISKRYGERLVKHGRITAKQLSHVKNTVLVMDGDSVITIHKHTRRLRRIK